MHKSIAVALIMTASLVSPANAGEPGARPLADLLTSLQSSNYQVRRKAVLAVAGREEPALFERVLAMAQHDPHPNIRGYSAGVLSGFEDPRVFHVLAAMASETAPGPRNDALVALGRLGDARAYPILIKRLHAGWAVRGYAARGLGLLGDARAFEPVAAVYAKHLDDPYLNDMAPEALVLIDKQRGLELLRASFTTVPSVARWGVAKELGRHPDAKTRQLMLAQLGKGGQEGTRRAAIHVLTALRDPESLDGLRKAFKAHPGDRAALARALGCVGDPRAVPVLVPALRDVKVGTEKNEIIAALGKIGDRRAVAALIPYLEDPEFVAQDMQRSSIGGFPTNVHVRGVALWAVRRILDGKEPFALSALVRFPERPAGKDVDGGIAKLKVWWADHESDARYRLEEK